MLGMRTGLCIHAWMAEKSLKREVSNECLLQFIKVALLSIASSTPGYSITQYACYNPECMVGK